MTLPIDSERLDSERTYWNGEDCVARRVWITVGDSGRFKKPWFADMIGQKREAVEVAYGKQTFYIDDSRGEGWDKVTAGRGSPRCGHGALDVQEGTDVAPR